ncbi:NADPH-dependent FMN reductase [Micromonosporaceae bacterium Da 78-11]
MTTSVRVLLIAGSTREGSTNLAALHTAAQVAPADLVTDLYPGLIGLPAFVPGDHPPPAEVVALRRQVAEADAVLFCTPEYAGTLPGSLKNLLDWLVGSGELNGKPVAWLNIAGPGRGEGAQATLELVLGYVDATIVRAACVRVPVSRDQVDAAGTVPDPHIRATIAAALSVLRDSVGRD